MNTADRQKQTQALVLFAILLALEALVAFTPLGSLPAIGPIVATLAMVPVVITAVMLGPVAGGLMGFFTGIFSFIVWTFITPPQSLAFAFVFTPFAPVGQQAGNAWSLVINFIPRIMTGVIAGLLYISFKKIKSQKLAFLWLFLSGFVGSLMNTAGVLGGIYLFFKEPYANIAELTYSILMKALMLTVLTSGIPEAVIGGLLALAVGLPAKKYIFKTPLSFAKEKTEYMVSFIAIAITIVIYIVGSLVN